VLMIVIAAACRAQAATESGWTMLQLPPGTLTDLRAVDVPAANVVVLGASGTILRTTDRGATCKRTLDRSRALGESATRTVRGPKGLQQMRTLAQPSVQRGPNGGRAARFNPSTLGLLTLMGAGTGYRSHREHVL
jgi:hypothetical protein